VLVVIPAAIMVLLVFLVQCVVSVLILPGTYFSLRIPLQSD
jgi:hypothetical protein